MAQQHEIRAVVESVRLDVEQLVEALTRLNAEIPAASATRIGEQLAAVSDQLLDNWTFDQEIVADEIGFVTDEVETLLGELRETFAVLDA